MEGVFHQSVILCEGDSDARFFGPVLRQMCRDTALVADDVMFASCGSKNRIHKAAAFLRQLGMNSIVLGDFDLLRGDGSLEKMCDEMAIDLEETIEGSKVRSLIAEIRSAISSETQDVTVATARQEITRILDKESEPVLGKETKLSIRRLLSHEDPWKKYTLGGDRLLAKGIRPKFAAVRDFLAQRGVFIHRIGCLESYVPDVSGEKDEFVVNAFEKHGLEDAALADARTAMTEVVDYILNAYTALPNSRLGSK